MERINFICNKTGKNIYSCEYFPVQNGDLIVVRNRLFRVKSKTHRIEKKCSEVYINEIKP